MTEANVLSGFRKTGLWPFNPSAVLDQVRMLVTQTYTLDHPLTRSCRVVPV
jgi:hypothetical protein